MTLLEMLIAVTIVVGAVAMSANFIKRKDNRAKKTFRQFVALNRQLDYQARLRQKTWRLVIQLSSDSTNSKNKGNNTWWVEKQISNNRLSTTFHTSSLEEQNATAHEESQEASQVAGQITPGEHYLSKNPSQTNASHTEKKVVKDFIIDTSLFEKPQKLPGALEFHSVEFYNQKLPVTEGKAYIYYFPSAEFTQALLKVKNKKHYWSVFVDRLHGDLVVFPGEKTLKDMEQ